MTKLTEFHKGTLELIYTIIVAIPRHILMTVTSLLLFAYILLIAMPTYILLGYNLREEVDELLKTEK